MAADSTGKASSGSPFRAPPATIWNNMVDAGRAFADGQLSSGTPAATRARATDLLNLKNSSGAMRRKGEILKIEGKVIETVTDENIWLDGVEPSTDCRFGILKTPADAIEVVAGQVSGVCLALVNITSTDHTFAAAAAGNYVLQSGATGSLEILYAPAGTGELECVVRFVGNDTGTGPGTGNSAGCCNTCIDCKYMTVDGFYAQSYYVSGIPSEFLPAAATLGELALEYIGLTSGITGFANNLYCWESDTFDYTCVAGTDTYFWRLIVMADGTSVCKSDGSDVAKLYLVRVGSAVVCDDLSDVNCESACGAGDAGPVGSCGSCIWVWCVDGVSVNGTCTAISSPYTSTWVLQTDCVGINCVCDGAPVNPGTTPDETKAENCTQF